VLSGKYLNGKKPADGRVTLFPNFSRFSSEQSNRATEMYAQLAADNNMSITQMSLAFVNDRSFVTSNIIGATKIEQLKENIDSHEITLSEEILKEIEAIHNIIPDPAP
jgi:aryl-alcohol dehydrogenase-like predicted oxidoreductase